MVATNRVGRTLFALVAAPLVVLTALRVSFLSRRRGFGALIEALKSRRARPLSPWLARPAELAGVVERLLVTLPPRDHGLCLRRALIVLELWSRCGLEPTLHLGFRFERPERDGHAWVTARGADGSALQVSGPLDSRPAFEL